MFLLSFWRHPFTAEDPLLSKWCNAKLFLICSDEKTKSSTWITWTWVHFLSFLGKLFFKISTFLSLQDNIKIEIQKLFVLSRVKRIKLHCQIMCWFGSVIFTTQWLTKTDCSHNHWFILYTITNKEQYLAERELKDSNSVSYEQIGS